MHPQLTLDNNPQCVDQILAFKKCHEECGYFARLMGTCNDAKVELDACFKKQKKSVRKGLLEKAREDRERWRQKCDELEAR